MRYGIQFSDNLGVHMYTGTGTKLPGTKLLLG